MANFIKLIDANKGKISLVLTFIAAGSAAIGYPVPVWAVGALAAAGFSTSIRLAAGNGA